MKRFYDIHFHAFNLSHPNVHLFLKRLTPDTVFSAGLGASLLAKVPFLLSFLMAELSSKINHSKNLLSIMDNSMFGYFQQIQMKLVSDTELFPEGPTGPLRIGNRLYDKIVLTPLMIDFGDKSMPDKGIFYNEPSDKPIKAQVVDVFGGIKGYKSAPGPKAFEIFPFLGINPLLAHMYTRDNEKDHIDYIEKNILKKYFDGYSFDPDLIWNTMDSFTGEIAAMGPNYFSGIKVYPPMGFEPWPSDQKDQRAVKVLYQYCCEHGIPITTHTSDGGFTGDSKQAVKRSDPHRWKEVLELYPSLKLNFAHFGKVHKINLGPIKHWRSHKWIKRIIEYIFEYPNVYVDFSYFGMSEKDYTFVMEAISKFGRGRRQRLVERVLFGSDFMINLLNIDSYNEYLKNFSRTRCFSDDEKELFCSINPERFLFGKVLKTPDCDKRG